MLSRLSLFAPFPFLTERDEEDGVIKIKNSLKLAKNTQVIHTVLSLQVYSKYCIIIALLFHSELTKNE